MKDDELKSAQIALKSSKEDLASHERQIRDLKEQLAYENNLNALIVKQQEELVDLRKTKIEL